MEAGLEKQSRIRVWDWTVRTFHWVLVLLILGMWSTAEGHGVWKQLDSFVVDAGWMEYGRGNMGWHRTIAIGVLFLLIYRVYWGVVGSTTARFSQFVKGPKSIMGYFKSLKDKPYKPSAGHNPIGALSVVALLLLLAAQLGTGLFTVDVDGLESGPLARHVDFDTGRLFADLHETAFRALYILIGLHVLAVAVYQFLLKANLVLPMFTGTQKKDTVKDVELLESKPVSAPILKVLIGVVLSAGLVYLIWTF